VLAALLDPADVQGPSEGRPSEPLAGLARGWASAAHELSLLAIQASKVSTMLTTAEVRWFWPARCPQLVRDTLPDQSLLAIAKDLQVGHFRTQNRSMPDAVKKPEKQRGRPFRPGVSGNPRGRPRGAR
jgi:hypothetical protein